MADGPSTKTPSVAPKLAFHHDLLAVASNVSFFFFRVGTTFCPSSTFSEVDLKLVPIATSEGHKIVVNAKHIFAFDRLEAKPEYAEAFKYIKNCKSKPWPPHSLTSTKEVVIALCQHLLVPLSRPDTVLLERGYTSFLSVLGPEREGLKTANLGMGSRKTWHGTPDVRVRGVEIIGHKVEDVADADEEDECRSTATEATDGATTSLEGKRLIKAKNLSQGVSTCVVSSFIEHNLHPTKQAAVPIILIDATQYQVCLYDCESDILLVSAPIPLAHPKERLSRHGLLLLWLVINHRLFLQPLPDDDSLTSTIKQRLKDNDFLSHFKTLTEKAGNWSGVATEKRIS